MYLQQDDMQNNRTECEPTGVCRSLKINIQENTPILYTLLTSVLAAYGIAADSRASSPSAGNTGPVLNIIPVLLV